jgi:hypothetical protein
MVRNRAGYWIAMLGVPSVVACKHPAILHVGARLVVGMFLLIFLGVAMPAVWSAKPARRHDASRVLQQILDFFRGPHSQRDDLDGR